MLPPMACASNGVSAEGLTHKEVVDMIRHAGDELKLVLISVKQQEAQMLEKEVERQHHASRDYFEKRSLPITIPDTRQEEKEGEKYTVFNVYLAGKYLTSRRYSEFVTLDQKVTAAYLLLYIFLSAICVYVCLVFCFDHLFCL